MSSFRNYCRRKHKQEPWRHRFGARKHPAACAKFNRGEPLTAEEALEISLKCSVCQRATKKRHLPGCDYSARNEVAWDLKRDRRAVAKAAKKATIKKEALLGTYNRRRCDYSLTRELSFLSSQQLISLLLW